MKALKKNYCTSDGGSNAINNGQKHLSYVVPCKARQCSYAVYFMQYKLWVIFKREILTFHKGSMPGFPRNLIRNCSYLVVAVVIGFWGHLVVIATGFCHWLMMPSPTINTHTPSFQQIISSESTSNLCVVCVYTYMYVCVCAEVIRLSCSCTAHSRPLQKICQVAQLVHPHNTQAQMFTSALSALC